MEAFVSPAGIEVFDNGALWVADCGDQRVKSVADGVVRPLRTDPLVLGCPADLVSTRLPDGSDATYLSDRDAGAIVVFQSGRPISILRPDVPPDVPLDVLPGITRPAGLVVVGGVLYISDLDLHCVLAYDLETNELRPHVGICGQPGVGRAGVNRRDVALRAPDGLAVWRNRLIVADSGNHRVLAIDPAGTVTVVAGSETGRFGFAGDGGPADAALLDQPFRLAVIGDTLYVSDNRNGRVRAIDASGSIDTVAGGGRVPPGESSDPLAVELRPIALDVDRTTLLLTSTGPGGGVFALEDGRLRRLA